MIFIGCCAGACTAVPKNDATISAPAITAIRNNKDIMDVKNSLFIGYPKYDNFTVCHGNTCRFIDHVGLSEKEWDEIRGIFTPLAVSPDEEREKIRIAVARL